MPFLELLRFFFFLAVRFFTAGFLGVVFLGVDRFFAAEGLLLLPDRGAMVSHSFYFGPIISGKYLECE